MYSEEYKVSYLLYPSKLTVLQKKYLDKQSSKNWPTESEFPYSKSAELTVML